MTKIRQAVTEKKEACLNLLNYKKDGSTFHNQFFLTPMFDAEGTLVSYSATVQQCFMNETAPLPCLHALMRLCFPLRCPSRDWYVGFGLPFRRRGDGLVPPLFPLQCRDSFSSSTEKNMFGSARV